MFRDKSKASFDEHSKLLQRLLLTLVMTLSASAASAQQLVIPVTDRLPSSSAQSSSEEEEDFIEPGRPGVANPAEFQEPGVLQVEIGYDANFRKDSERDVSITKSSTR